jgi:hypothetical protein
MFLTNIDKNPCLLFYLAIIIAHQGTQGTSFTFLELVSKFGKNCRCDHFVLGVESCKTFNGSPMCTCVP